MTVFTEEEAKGKVCPMKLSQKEAMASRSHCLGSKCMWWKWRELRATTMDLPYKQEKEKMGYCGGVK